MERFLGLILLLVVFGMTFGFIAIVMKAVSKAKSDTWEGEVIDKTIGEHTWRDNRGNTHIEHVPYLRVRFTDGSERNIPVSPQLYNDVKIGDRLKKEKGSIAPRKIS